MVPRPTTAAGAQVLLEHLVAHQQQIPRHEWRSLSEAEILPLPSGGPIAPSAVIMYSPALFARYGQLLDYVHFEDKQVAGDRCLSPPPVIPVQLLRSTPSCPRRFPMVRGVLYLVWYSSPPCSMGFVFHPTILDGLARCVCVSNVLGEGCSNFSI